MHAGKWIITQLWWQVDDGALDASPIVQGHVLLSTVQPSAVHMSAAGSVLSWCAAGAYPPPHKIAVCYYSKLLSNTNLIIKHLVVWRGTGDMLSGPALVVLEEVQFHSHAASQVHHAQHSLHAMGCWFAVPAQLYPSSL